MLTIRNEQLAVLRRSSLDRFEDDLVAHLLTCFPGPSATVGGETEMRGFVRKGVERAAGHGIEETGAVTVLLELAIQYGEAFERSPSREWVAAILAHPVLPGYVKVAAIRDRLDEEAAGRVLIPF